MSDERDIGALPFPQAPEAVELRHLRSFVAVAEELSYTRAAERLHLSRPALSRQVAALERLVGVQLLQRTTHHVALTFAGEELLERARSALGQIDAAIRMTQSVGGALVGRAAQLWNPIGEQLNDDDDIEAGRRAFESLHANFSPPDDVGVRPVSAGGVPGLVASPTGAPPVTTMHLHGGGHVMGSAFGYRHLAGALAVETGTGVLVPDYRLAPEHPHPADLDDALTAYRWLLEQGADPSDLLVVGDSSGALLALGMLIVLRDHGQPLPGCVALLCPSVDISWPCPYPSPDLEAAMARLRRWTAMYLGAHPTDDPVLNPTTADLTGLPPILLQACTGDPVLDHAHRLAENAQACGVETHVELYPTAIHDFQIFWALLPEAADALAHVARFAQRTRAASESSPRA
ncbi:MAG TPA: alpha/beta hydrolase fold domain-containing protein [Conexibacter sp.]|nr:alpha/beta hydrolase fold domain-containing protein [Conexibacter sp.]